MPKITAQDIADSVKALYKPKDKGGRDVISTGVNLKRPTKAEDFVIAPESHPWRTLTGMMGIPYDIITQVAGAPDAGKSTLGGEALAWAQAQGVYCILWDTENKFDPNRFQTYFGGDPAELNIIGTTIIRKGAGALFKYIKKIKELDPSAKILVVHDSVGGSVSKARADHEMDDEKNVQPGPEAVENSEYMRHVVAHFDRYPGSIALLLINQMTDRIGGLGKSRSGGNKISFHSSMIVEMTRIQDLTKIVNKVKVKTGIISRAKIAKNHISLTENSVYEMRIKVTAKGWQFLEPGSEGEADSEESEA